MFRVIQILYMAKKGKGGRERVKEIDPWSVCSLYREIVREIHRVISIK